MEKYNQSLKLKKTYDKKIIKNQILILFSSYIYLGYHILKLDYLTELQKLNCILKINDITLLNIKSKHISDLIPLIKENIKFEVNKTIKYAKSLSIIFANTKRSENYFDAIKKIRFK